MLPPPPALLASNPLAWLTVFGPGAIVASLTIGTGELIFATRGGALFGYRVLFLFVVILLLKWALVVSLARHIVLTGVHPYARLRELPGPRGWFPLVLLLLAAVCVPMWVSFHSGVLGNLIAWVAAAAGAGEAPGGAWDHIWGGAILAAVIALAAAGGYSALERVQLAIVLAMLAAAAITLLLYGPDWLGLLEGAVVPAPLEYPPWLAGAYPEIAAQPVWIETTRYAGVIGGAGYDYLAYAAFLRDKRWGHAGAEPASEAELAAAAADPSHPLRRWLRAPLVDATLSFAAVLAFSAVFVACGALILGPEHQVPDEENLLSLQARFVTELHPWLLPLYVTGAFLTLLGTLYGTIEVGHTIAREVVISFRPRLDARSLGRLRLLSLAWCGAGAAIVLAASLAYQAAGEEGTPPILLAVLTPANLFTGVLLSGVLAWLAVWIERRFLPRPLRAPRALHALLLAAGLVFVALGLKGYRDSGSPWLALGGIAGAVLVALAVARRLELGGRR